MSLNVLFGCEPIEGRRVVCEARRGDLYLEWEGRLVGDTLTLTQASMWDADDPNPDNGVTYTSVEELYAGGWSATVLEAALRACLDDLEAQGCEPRY